MSRLLGLVDCNNFYVSCERCFQPELRNKPVVVLSNNDGCAIARSNEAKALGIKMGDPWHLNRRKWHEAGVIIRSSNYALYGDMSHRVMSILRSFTPAVEVYSIDEAFIDLAGLHGRERDVASDLRAKILMWTGIPVSVGIAPTKTLAKVASRTSKKDPVSGGVCALPTDHEQQAALANLELNDLWGIAGRMAARLRAIGIKTPLELRDAPPDLLCREGGVVLERIGRELRGERCLELVDGRQPAKSIMASRSFGQTVHLRADLEQAVATFVTRAAEKLRRQHLVAGSVMVFIHTNPFQKSERQYSASDVVRLGVGSADTSKLITAALRGLKKIYRLGFRYAKAGVMLDELEPANLVQGNLWQTGDSWQSKATMQTLDRLNREWGRGTVIPAACGIRHSWSMRAAHLSRRFTTRWDELLQIGRKAASVG